jgi:hypothetical protein
LASESTEAADRRVEREIEDVSEESIEQISERRGADDCRRHVTFGLRQAHVRGQRERHDHEPHVPIEDAQVEQRNAAAEGQQATDESEEAERKDESLHPWIEPTAAWQSRGI